MRSRILCVLLGLAMGWTVGCATARFPHPPKLKEQPKGQLKEQPDQHPRPIPTPGRQIGLLKWGSTCPPVYGWRTESLLELAVAHAEDGVKNSCDPNSPPPKRTRIDRERQARVNALFHEHGLDRICFYTDQGTGQPFQKPFKLSNVGPDKLALTPNAPTDLDSLGDQIWAPLAQHFLNQVGTAQLNSTDNPVRLVFVDTHPTGEGLPAKNPALSSLHGYGMAHLSYELVCGHDTPPQNCPIHIASRLALRYENYDYPDPTDPNATDDPGSDNGGHQGRIGDLAIAIAAEIEHWKTLQPRPKLILSLSVGWDGEYIDPNAHKKEKLDAATQAVYSALDTAHDLGVLVIAAAGNRSGGQTSQEPLLPAAWEAGDKKVAYAVGGVDRQGLPLPNARPGGMPVRVAYADHAVVNTSGVAGVLEPTKIYTGSSVAAVVASSTAAVVWHLQPGLTQDQVMDQVDGAAETLPSYSSSTPPYLKRLSLCRTLNHCGGGNPCSACPNYPAANLSGIVPNVSSPLPVDSITINPPSCSPQADTYSKSGKSILVTSSCPMETLPDMNAPSLTQTQPPDTPCPPCTIAPTLNQFVSLTPSLVPDLDAPKPYDLAAAFDPDWLAQAAQATISSAVLVIECNTDPHITERLDVTQQFSNLLQASRTATPPLAPIRIGFGPIGNLTSLENCTASVDFKLNALVNGSTKERSVQSPVYVDP